MLKLLRESKGLKQETVAAYAPRNDKGEPMSLPTVSNAENDRFSSDTLKRILTVLQIEMDAFNNLIERLNAAWTSPARDVTQELADAAFWHSYTALSDEGRKAVRRVADSLRTYEQDAAERQQRTPT